MKSLFVIIAVMFSISAQATFVESPYLWGLQKRYDKMVNNDGDISLDLEHKIHQDWVDVTGMIRDLQDDEFMIDTDSNKLGDKNRTEQVMEILNPSNMAEFYCFPLSQSGDWYDINEEECRESIKKLLGDVAEKADSVYVVWRHGEYYGDWEDFVFIFSDYETKETMTLYMPLYHEI